jgi:hypothetical protein
MTEPTRKVVRHASHPEPDRALCGARNGSRTRPKEQVNCPECRVILNHVRDRYPAHARYGDWRLTREQVAGLERLVDSERGRADHNEAKKDFVRDGECVNGDGRPICPPSAVLCRECLDGFTQAELDALLAAVRADEREQCARVVEGRFPFLISDGELVVADLAAAIRSRKG